MNTKIIKFDINKNLYDTLIAKQGDTKSRFLLFNLLDGSIPFSLENRSVRVYAIKPDGTEVFNDLIITDATKGYCILELTTQILAVAGTVKLELMVIENEKKLTSNIFYMSVKESINSEKAIVSTNEFGALLTALQDVDNWNKEFTEKSGKLEELYTPRLNELGEQMDNIEINKTDKTTTQNLQTQVNNLVLQAGNPEATSAEISQARGGYNVLSERLNIYDYLAFKNAEEFDDSILNANDNYYINTNGDLPTDSNYVTSSGIKVNLGDIIIYEGYVDNFAVSVGGWKNNVFVKKISSDVFGVKTKNAYVCDGTYDTVFCCAKKGYDYSIAIIRNNKTIKYGNVIHVGKGSYDYNEIQDAINSITDDSENNYYTIIVHEGTYKHFYTWVYGIKPRSTKRYINIIGVDKYRCVINSTFNSTFESNGMLMGLTLINNNLEADYSGMELNKHYDSQARYALHIDYNCNGNKILVKDCILISVFGSAIGVGTWSYDDFTFDNCEFYCYSADNTKAGVFFHNCGVPGTLYQKIKLKNCDIYSDSHTSIRIQNAILDGSNSELDCEFINCIGYSKINGYDSIGILGFNGFGDRGITLNKLSFGNSSNLLNNPIGNGNYISLA